LRFQYYFTANASCPAAWPGRIFLPNGSVSTGSCKKPQGKRRVFEAGSHCFKPDAVPTVSVPAQLSAGLLV
jgi:hypothetical protein